MDEVELKQHLAELFDKIYPDSGQALPRNEAAVILWGIIAAYHEPPKPLIGKTLFYRLVETLQQPKTVRYTPARANKLKRRLATFSEAEMVRAAQSIASDEHMMGDNDRNKKYANIDYLLRNDEIVDRWLAEANEDGGANNGLDLRKLDF